MSPRILPVVDIGLESRPFSSRITSPRRAKGESRSRAAFASDLSRFRVRPVAPVYPLIPPRPRHSGCRAEGWSGRRSRTPCSRPCYLARALFPVRLRPRPPGSRAAAAVRPRAAPVRPDHGPSAPCAGAAAARPRPPSSSAVLPRSHKPHAPTGTRRPVPAARVVSRISPAAKTRTARTNTATCMMRRFYTLTLTR